ncbi:hypothetical protein KP509_25G026800 [Ceratopteris richardii]|uniref:Carrier domain-containing protein n=1 Tax=Ceratopteris richardii TaxID=49495 RepID=A0A8T2RQ52_CERRI|nr:hypothetical protein KP509_25G026800 [Ceratopteris richardii]
MCYEHKGSRAPATSKKGGTQSRQGCFFGILQHVTKGKASFLNEWEIVVNVLKKFEKVEPSTISAAAHFQQNFGLNNLDTCELVMAFQEKFSIKSPDSEANKIDSCAVAIDYIIKNGKPS